jgi:hypothetical protein
MMMKIVTPYTVTYNGFVGHMIPVFPILGMTGPNVRIFGQRIFTSNTGAGMTGLQVFDRIGARLVQEGYQPDYHFIAFF